MARVLVAEDDGLVRALLVRCLRRDGHEVVEAADGAAAIAALHGSEAFDLVVTDHSMPKASGVEVVSEAARIDPTLPCIVVTAFHDLDVATRAMDAGAVAFLPKPFRPRELSVVVHRALERRTLAEETIRLRLLAPMLERVTLLLANTIEAKDRPTQRHCERLVASADAIAARLGVGETERGDVRLGACLHDVGKIGVPESLLRSPRPLTSEEHALLRRHTEIGADILADVEAWQPVRRIVRHHHERFDGTGYPDGLAGTAIPLGARIVAVADAYDVIVSGRPYRPPRSPDAAIAELRAGRGGQFDPECVDAFLAVIEGLSDPVAIEVVGHGSARARTAAPPPT